MHTSWSSSSTSVFQRSCRVRSRSSAERHGFELTFDVESRLVEAKKPGQATIAYHYDDTGEKKLTVIKKPGEIYR